MLKDFLFFTEYKVVWCLVLPAAFFPALTGKITEPTVMFTFAVIPVFTPALEGTAPPISSALTCIFHTYGTAVEINVLEPAENFVYRCVFDFKEGVYPFKIDFTDSLSANPSCIANIP